MWPWKKKEKKEPSRLAVDDILLRNLATSLKPKCPRAGDCICYDCQSRGMCAIENAMRESQACWVNDPGAPRITECSLQKARKGELDGKKKSSGFKLRTPIHEYRIDILDPD